MTFKRSEETRPLYESMSTRNDGSSKEYFARVHRDPDGSVRKQGLEDHLEGVATLARGFAGAFDSEEWGYLAGLWHDLGKFQIAFQKRLEDDSIKVEHSGLGAALAEERLKGSPLAFAIAGHHSGLANNIQSGDGLPTPLVERVARNNELLKQIRPSIPRAITERDQPSPPTFLMSLQKNPELMRKRSLWVRFLFSALVDADRLNSAEFCDPDRIARGKGYTTIPKLRSRLEEYINRKVENISEEGRSHPVNRARTGILEACINASERKPGFFSLTVPTGGGKTLSGLSFALKHAETHGLRRVIVVIPYTSIIEQSATEYRRAVGSENVIEHHSNLDVEKLKKEQGEHVAERHDLAIENWDAPLIVTTTVQFFETLFGSGASQCRKLHNVARSAIILDEVQSLPPEFLLPIVEALRWLVENYGCTVVLSTATPPALQKRPTFTDGIAEIFPIIEDPLGLSRKLKRVDYQWSLLESEPFENEQLGSELAQHDRVLAVVNRRNDARETAERLRETVDPESVFHLSALMCPAHRSHIIDKVKEKLSSGEPCRLVSTQLIEAGVDIDFPAVYRAMAGLDSIVQAAGRCNREGKLDKGQVFIFRSKNPPPKGTPKKGKDVTESMILESGGPLELDDPAIFERYFRQLYFIQNQDVKAIRTNLQAFNFATVGRDFKLIEDGFTKDLVVPYDDSMDRVSRFQELCRKEKTRELVEARRALQPYVVRVYDNSFRSLVMNGAVEEVVNGVWVVKKEYFHIYDEKTFGLIVGDEMYPGSGSFVV